jgi:hypothetical protein
MHGGDVLDDGQAESGPAVGPTAGIVHAVEALEDPLMLAGRDADAVVRDTDLDLDVLASGSNVGPDDDPSTGI